MSGNRAGAGAPGSGRDAAFLVALFAVALALRLAYVFDYSHAAVGRVLVLDGLFHDRWAKALAAGDWWGTTPFFRAPLYGYLLGAFYALFGPRVLAVRALQAVLGACSVLLTYRLGRRVFDRRVARISGLAMALYWIPVYYDGEILLDALVLFLDLLILDRLLTATESGRARDWLLAGLLFGVSAITRPNVLLFGAVLGAWLLVRSRRSPSGTALGRPPSGRPALRAALLLLAGVVVPILPVTLHNAIAGGDLVLIASQGGINFYLGNGPGASGHSAISEDLRQDWWGGFDDSVRQAEAAAGRPLRPSEVSRYWTGQALRFFAAHPFEEARLLAKKVHLYWIGHELGNNRDLHHHAARFWELRFSPVRFVWVAPFALLGLLVFGRKGRAAIPALFVVTYMVSVVLFFVCTRFRLPTLPVVLVFAAAALVETWEVARSGDRRRLLARRAAPLALLAGIVTWDPYGLRAGAPAQAYFQDGLVYSQDGDPARAEAAYLQAIRLDPDYADPRVNLAHVLIEQGRPAEARTLLQEAIAIAPDFALAYYNLGVVSEGLGDGDGARRAFEGALRADPDYADALLRLGLLLERSNLQREADPYLLRAAFEYAELDRMTPSRTRTMFEEGLREKTALALRGAARAEGRRGAWDAAVADYRKAVELEPNADGMWGLAYALEKTGGVAEAAQWYHQAVAADSTHVPARYALAQFHLRYGRWGPAQQWLEEVLKLDPTHTGALYNLGVVLAQSGQYDKAEEAWTKLLAIDPKDAQARAALAELYKVTGRNR